MRIELLSRRHQSGPVDQHVPAQTLHLPCPLLSPYDDLGNDDADIPVPQTNVHREAGRPRYSGISVERVQCRPVRCWLQMVFNCKNVWSD